MINEALNTVDHIVTEMGIPAMKTSSETFKSREQVSVLWGFLTGKLVKTEKIEIHSQQKATQPWSKHGLIKDVSTHSPHLKEEEQQQQKYPKEL